MNKKIENGEAPKKVTPRTPRKKVETPIEFEKEDLKPEIKIETKLEFPYRKEMNKLEIAYEEAIDGKIKFKEVKNIFEKLHKEIKKSVKGN